VPGSERKGSLLCPVARNCVNVRVTASAGGNVNDYLLWTRPGNVNLKRIRVRLVSLIQNANLLTDFTSAECKKGLDGLEVIAAFMDIAQNENLSVRRV
jgi:hypothetical protein